MIKATKATISSNTLAIELQQDGVIKIISHASIRGAKIKQNLLLNRDQVPGLIVGLKRLPVSGG